MNSLPISCHSRFSPAFGLGHKLEEVMCSSGHLCKVPGVYCRPPLCKVVDFLQDGLDKGRSPSLSVCLPRLVLVMGSLGKTISERLYKSKTLNPQAYSTVGFVFCAQWVV